MTGEGGVTAMLRLCTAILAIGALYFARSIFAPVACSLFIIAIVWPFQRALQARMPRLVAVTITVFATLVVVTVLASMIVWGFGRAGQWLINNTPRFQLLYVEATNWLEGHDIFLGALLVEHFNVNWLLRAFQRISAGIHGLVSFAFITFIFTVLGLLEVDFVTKKVERLENREIGQTLLRAGAETATKLQKFMLVRSLMSVMTGLAVWGFTSLAGMELATAWGVIAFAFNYIPFIGPLVATIFPTLFAFAQSESWQMAVIVFLGLNLIQFLLGSYLEPRIAGAALSISPFMVLFMVFFWTFLWGIPGAFIGVPIMIAFVTICEQHQSSRWIATLVSGPDRETTRP
jgi:predicted PurR-regulated permease PerM